MNRRSFLIGLLAGISTFAGSLMASEVLWLKKGSGVSYVEKSTTTKMCSLCKHFKDDNKFPDGGLCTLRAVNKGKTVYVKKEGVCSMFQKKAA
ncbi:MAG: hypothetical protein ACJ76H_04855 [Bacteriovoracaceae bacterium]